MVMNDNGTSRQGSKTRTSSTVLTRIVRMKINLFVNIVTQPSVSPDGRDRARNLFPSSASDEL